MTIQKERAITLGIAAILGLTICFSALAFSYLRNPPAEDPWTYRDIPDRSPDIALSDIAAELLGTRSQFVKTVAPETVTGSHEIHFTSQGHPLVVRVKPDPSDPLRGTLTWDTPKGPRPICRGVRPGGFRVMEMSDGWILKLEVVRMDREGRPTDLAATKTVKRPPPAKKK